jgi:signal peptidase I
VLVDKLAYRFGDTPRRGDVIVFDGEGSFQQTGGTDYVKRVIGVGGDRVTCCDTAGRITVNGQALDETYLYPGDAPSQVPFDIVVPDGRLWVMGDHRADSRDSRDHLGDPGGGTVPVDKVIGRAEWIAWPAGHWTKLDRPATFAAVPAPAVAAAPALSAEPAVPAAPAAPVVPAAPAVPAVPATGPNSSAVSASPAGRHG